MWKTAFTAAYVCANNETNDPSSSQQTEMQKRLLERQSTNNTRLHRSSWPLTAMQTDGRTDRQTPDCGFHRRHMVPKESTCQQREKWLIAGHNYPSKHREVPVILWSMIGICVQWVSNFHLLHFFHLKTNHRGQHSCFYKSRDRKTKSILAVSGTVGQKSSETNTKANHKIKKILIYCC